MNVPAQLAWVGSTHGFWNKNFSITDADAINHTMQNRYIASYMVVILLSDNIWLVPH